MSSDETVPDPNVYHKPNPIGNERQEYFQALEKWLLDAYAWESVASSFSYLLFSNELNQNNLAQQWSFPYDPFGDIHGAVEDEPPDAPAPFFGAGAGLFQRPNHTAPPMQAVICRIPPVWKRVVAEFLDFLILFFLKLAITFVAIDFFDAINLENYGSKVVDPNGRINYKMVVAATSQVLILEFIHRIVVCVFEAYWLRRGHDGEVGGATPGKALMGLRVLSCLRVENMENRPTHVVLVYPGTDLGLAGAISRAILKNVILAVLFPLCFALFFFKHHRTGYDVVCRSIVVERPHRHRQ